MPRRRETNWVTRRVRALNSESFCERVLSAGKLILPSKGTSLHDSMVALMDHTVYTVYSGTVYFVQIVYFRTSKMHTCPLRVSVHCVLCIAYSAANLYSVFMLSRDRLFLETYTQPTRNSYPTLNGISHLSHFGWENLLYPPKRKSYTVVARVVASPRT